MDTEELRTLLEEVGLSPYQADAYVALLELGAASAREVADASGVPDPRIYDILRALEDDGFVVTYEQDKIYARARDPQEALVPLRSQARRIDAAIEEIERRWQAPSVEAHDISVVRQFETVFERGQGFVDDAVYHVEVSATPDQYARLRPALVDATERELVVQVSLYEPADTNRSIDQLVFEGACTEARVREVPCSYSPFIVIADRERAAFAPQAYGRREYGALVDDPIHAYLFHWFFMTALWEVWDPVHVRADAGPPYNYVEIRDCIRTVEPLLESGVTVEATVEGSWVTTGRECVVSGRIVGVEYAGGREAAGSPGPGLVALIGRATVVVETDEGETYTVGGDGSGVEDIEADVIRIEQIDPDSAEP